MNTAMFIDREISADYKISTDNKVLVQIEKIRQAQDETGEIYASANKL